MNAESMLFLDSFNLFSFVFVQAPGINSFILID